MHTKDTRRMVLCAICIAVCFVVTRFLAVPVFYTKGYVNLGDVTVLLIAYIIGGSYGALSAGIGSCMADASLSFYYYVPATFVIKALMVLIADFFFEHAEKKSSKKLMFLWIVLGVIIAEVFIVEGYFLFYNIVFFFLCLVTTVSILDSRTETDYVGNDKEIYVVFWFIFNIMNFVLIWKSCQSLGQSQILQEGAETETSEERILRLGTDYRLSERELEIAQLLCRGKNNNDIAAQLFLSPNTVKVHTSNLYKKLGVKNRVQAVQVLRGESIEREAE